MINKCLLQCGKLYSRDKRSLFNYIDDDDDEDIISIQILVNSFSVYSNGEKYILHLNN